MACGCSGSMERDFKHVVPSANVGGTDYAPSTELRQWPVQLHLLNPQASFFREADILLASNCSAFSYGNFQCHVAEECFRLPKTQEKNRELISRSSGSFSQFREMLYPRTGFKKEIVHREPSWSGNKKNYESCQINKCQFLNLKRIPSMCHKKSHTHCESHRYKCQSCKEACYHKQTGYKLSADCQ